MNPFIDWLYLEHPYPNKRVRITLHLVFWILMTLFLFSQHYESLSRQTIDAPILYVLAITLVPLILNYYLISNWGIPALLQKSFIRFAACMLVVHVTTTAAYHYLLPLLSETQSAYRRLAQLYIPNDLFTALRSWSVFIYNCSFSFLQLLIPSLIKFLKSVYTLRMQKQHLEKEKLTFELQTLKARIQPHFIFNALHTMYAMTLERDPELALQLIHLSDLFEYELRDEAFIDLEQAITFIESYISLQKMRVDPSQVVIEYKTQGSFTGFLIPPLLLITFIENAFKHSYSQHLRWVKIQLEVDPKGELVLKVENSRQLGKVSTSGQGVLITQRRLDLLYPNKHSLIIVPQADSFRVTLTLCLSSSLKIKHS